MVGKQLTNGNHKDLAWPYHIDHSVRVFEDLNHHFLLILRWGPVLGMGARMDNAIHIQVKIVEFLAVWVGASAVNRNDGAIVHGKRLVLNHRRYDLGVFVGKPSEGRGNTHIVECCGLSSLESRRIFCGLFNTMARGLSRRR